MSPDGASVYAASQFSSTVAHLVRSGVDGSLTYERCHAPSNANGQGCVDLPGTSPITASIGFPSNVAVSPDGRSVYVVSIVSSTLVRFSRELPPGPPPPPPPPPSPPLPPASGPPPPVGDTLAPVVSRFALAPKRVRRSALFRFALSEPAEVRIVLERARPGRRVRKRCMAPARRLRGRPACTRFTSAGRLAVTRRPAGASTVSFNGRIGRRVLSAGRYRATITAIDAAGNRSAPLRASFRIVGKGR